MNRAEMESFVRNVYNQGYAFVSHNLWLGEYRQHSADMLFRIGVCVFKNVGGCYELVKNDSGRYCPEYPV